VARRSWLALALVAALVLGLSRLPVRPWLEAVQAWAAGFGPWGAPLFAALFVPASVLMIPGALIGILCGFAFELVPAVLSVIVFSNLGAQAAFLVGRALLRGRLQPWVARDARRSAVERAVSEQGFRLVLLLRFSPLLPFNALNYALSVSRISFRDYALATFLGMLPGTVLYCSLANALGRAGKSMTGKLETGAWGNVLLGLGIAASLAAVVLVTRRARRILAETMNSPDVPSADTEQARYALAAEVVGSLAGTAVAQLGSVTWPLFGAVAGPLLKSSLEPLFRDFSRRSLSATETRRVDAVARHALKQIESRLARGDIARADGFLQPSSAGHTPVAELFEAVLLKCKNEPEERKAGFLGNLLANAVFEPIPAGDLTSVLSLASRMTFRQMCLLALVVRAKEIGFDVFSLDRLRNSSATRETAFIFRDWTELREPSMGVIVPRPPVDVGFAPPTKIGEITYSLLGLQDLPVDDLATLKQAIAAGLGAR
jgi:uncharacterized membrane protein YdjX (TVP38/TMEM64 family)